MPRVNGCGADGFPVPVMGHTLYRLCISAQNSLKNSRQFPCALLTFTTFQLPGVSGYCPAIFERSWPLFLAISSRCAPPMAHRHTYSENIAPQPFPLSPWHFKVSEMPGRGPTIVHCDRTWAIMANSDCLIHIMRSSAPQNEILHH